MDADIAYVVIEPLLRDVVALVDLPFGSGGLLFALTHLLLRVDRPELVVELRITTRKDQDIVQRGRPRNGYINPLPELSWVLVLQEPPIRKSRSCLGS